ncbi:GNAT family N-acetyltransferase [Pseudomonas solani]|uniref:GNAT family N-acetyltransferase n=1 Tax=Pseudomonas solani TaxID=2731552 RepID=A0AAU7YB17_9PSED
MTLPTVRRARSADTEALVALDPIAREQPSRKAFIAQAVAADQCWVAVETHDDSTLLGYGVLDRSFFEHDFIALVMVKDGARRRGVASALMAELERQCTGPKLFTSTNASNAPMLALLARHGFTPSGRIDNLDEGDPEWVFVKFTAHTSNG